MNEFDFSRMIVARMFKGGRINIPTCDSPKNL